MTEKDKRIANVLMALIRENVESDLCNFSLKQLRSIWAVLK
jgi:hypothetical protein